MIMKYMCIYHERKGTIQFARIETVKDYIAWSESAHENGVVWSHLIEKDSGTLIMSFVEDSNGETKYHLH